MKIRPCTAVMAIFFICGVMLSSWNIAAASKPLGPIIEESLVTFFSEQELTGPVVSNAMPLPPSTSGFFELNIRGNPVGGAASAVFTLEVSSDNGQTWRGVGGGGGLLGGTPFGSTLGGSITATPEGDGLPTDARIVINVTGTAIVTMTGKFLAPTNVDITSIPAGFGSGVAVNPTTDLVYSIASFSLIVIDSSSNLVVSRIPLGTANLRGVAVNSRTNRIYVVGNAGLSVIDGNTHTVIGFVGMSLCSQVAVNPRTNRVYVTCDESQTVAVIDGASNTLLTAVPIPHPSALAVNPLTNRIYAGSGETPGSFPPITVIDGNTDTIMATIPIGVRPYGLAVDTVSNRLYVTERIRQTLSVINGDTNQVVDTIPLGGNPHGVAVDATRDRVYVAMDGAFVSHPGGYVFIFKGSNRQIIETVPITTSVTERSIDVLSARKHKTRVYVGGIYGVVSSFEDNFHGRADLPDLAIGVSPLPSSVAVGTVLSVPFIVTNIPKSGPGMATNVVVFLNLTRNLSFISVSSTHQGSCEMLRPNNRGLRIECKIPQLHPGGHIDILLNATVVESGEINMVGDVRADQVDVIRFNSEFFLLSNE